MVAQLLRFLLIFASVLAGSAVAAQELPGPSVRPVVPLPDEDLRQITVSLLQRYPELAGSPGAKLATTYLGGSATNVAATVLYYPHTERQGVKEAFEAHCRRTDPAQTWTCDEVEIRRYLQLASQDWEVRVKGAISSDAALALIEESRRVLQASLTDVSSSSTAVMITELLDGQYFITWGTSDGRWNVKLLAQLADGGDPTNPSDWRSSIFNPPDPSIPSIVRL